jgi:hypothetical protein
MLASGRLSVSYLEIRNLKFRVYKFIEKIIGKTGFNLLITGTEFMNRAWRNFYNLMQFKFCGLYIPHTCKIFPKVSTLTW